MMLARDTLEKQNIRLDLLAYDTERNPESVKKLLDTDELKSSDLLVSIIPDGPSFQLENSQVQGFSEKNKINVINPVSNKAEFLGSNPFSWLYQPSHETLGVRSAEYLNAHVRNKNCIVFYGDSPKDSVMAFGFMRTAVGLGMKVVLAQEFSKETSNAIKSILATETEFDEFKNPIQFKLKRDSIGSIFVASDEPLIYTKVISAVELRADSTVILGNENWLLDRSFDFEKLQRLRLVMAAPNFTSLHNPDFIRFRKKYLQTYGVIPSYYDLPSSYARIGYEFMLFAGHMLGKYGVYFQKGFEQETFIRGNLVNGYSFQQAHSNQVFPFIKFSNGELAPTE
jgi:hypothetical protein